MKAKISNLVQLVVLATLLTLVALRWGAIAAIGLFIAFALVGLPVFYGFVVLPSELVRRRRLAELTVQRGWTYHRRNDPALPARLPLFLIPGSWTRNVRFSDVVAGQTGGRPFLSFHRRYSFSVTEPGAYGDGQTVHSVFHWIVLVGGLPASLPAISCRSLRPVLDPGLGVLAGDSTEFLTGDPAFDQSFRIDGPASLLAQGLAEQFRILMPELAAGAAGDFSWQSADGMLATWRADGLYTDPKLLEPVLTALVTIADVIAQASPGQPR